jgi:hypothetical protein
LAKVSQVISQSQRWIIQVGLNLYTPIYKV